MRPDAYKELTPIIYGQNAIKWLPRLQVPSGGTCFTMHWHERLELLYIHEGEIDLHLGGEQMTAGAGQLAIINPCQLHAARAGRQAACYDVIMFDISHYLNGTAVVQHYLSPLVERDTAFVNLTEDPDVLQAVTHLIELQKAENRNPMYSIGEVYRLLALLVERCSTGRQAVYVADKKFGMVLDYINNHFTEKVSADTLSRQFSYNESYFCRLFKRMTGLTVSAYVRILRLELAQKLLRESDADMAVIAAACGFADPWYFTNCFTKQFGLPPTAFRRQQKSTITK